MIQKGEIQRIQNAIDHSLIDSILIYPSSYSAICKYLSCSLSEYPHKCHSVFSKKNIFLLAKMNPLFDNDSFKFNDNTEENEINLIIQEDKLELLKNKFVQHEIELNHKDKKGISLIEKCAFFHSKRCLVFLNEENVSIDRRVIKIQNFNFEIGLMEYGAIRGNIEIINFCLEKGQKIQKITLILGLIGHHNEMVEMLIEVGKQKGFLDEEIEQSLLGITDNIEFNEKILEKGANLKMLNKGINDKQKHH